MWLHPYKVENEKRSTLFFQHVEIISNLPWVGFGKPYQRYFLDSLGVSPQVVLLAFKSLYLPLTVTFLPQQTRLCHFIWSSSWDGVSVVSLPQPSPLLFFWLIVFYCSYVWQKPFQLHVLVCGALLAWLTDWPPHLEDAAVLTELTFINRPVPDGHRSIILTDVYLSLFSLLLHLFWIPIRTFSVNWLSLPWIR